MINTPMEDDILQAQEALERIVELQNEQKDLLEQLILDLKNLYGTR